MYGYVLYDFWYKREGSIWLDDNHILRKDRTNIQGFVWLATKHLCERSFLKSPWPMNPRQQITSPGLAEHNSKLPHLGGRTFMINEAFTVLTLLLMIQNVFLGIYCKENSWPCILKRRERETFRELCCDFLLLEYIQGFHLYLTLTFKYTTVNC